MRRLSDPEYVAFLNDVHVFVPMDSGDSQAYDPPEWGGIVGWGGMFVLVYPLPNGGVELTDITDGIVWGNPPNQTIVRIQDYLANVPITELGGGVARVYGFAQGFLEGLRNVAQLPSIAIDWAPLVMILIGVFFIGRTFSHGH